MTIRRTGVFKTLFISLILILTQAGVAFPPLKYDSPLLLNRNTVALASVHEEFTYPPGAFEIVSNGLWQRTIGNTPAQVVAAPLQIPDRYSSSNSINVSNQNVGYDYQPILSDAFEMQPGIPFYLGSYFNVAQIDEDQVIRVIFRVDDNIAGDQWIRLHATKDNGQLYARLSLSSATSNNGSISILAGQTFHFVVKGIWDGVSKISYSYAITPDLLESPTAWSAVGTFHSVSGPPKIGRILLGSSSAGNQGSLTAIRLSQVYEEVVIPNTITNEPPVIDNQTFQIVEGAAVNTNVGNVAATDDHGITQYVIKQAEVLKSGVPFPSDAVINASTMFSIGLTTGEIRVNDPTHLLAVNGPVRLTVEVRDVQGLSDQAIITILVDDLIISPSEVIPVNWTTGISMPFGTSEAQGIILGSKWYVFSGFDGIKFSQSQIFTPTNRAYVYDFILRTWSPIQPVPAMHQGTTFGGVTHSGFATDGTDIYFAGGFAADASGKAQLFGTIKAFKYIVAENRYVALPNFPGGRASGELEYVQGKLYYVGGTNVTRDQDQSDLFVLDLSNLQTGWIKKAPLPNPRSHAGTTVLNGKIYVVGGQHEHDEEAIQQDDIHMYDPLLDKWSKVTDLPDIDEVPATDSPGKSHITGGTFSYGEKIYVVAGEYTHGGPYSAAVLAYEPAANRWTRFSDLPFPIASGVAGIYDATLYYSSGLFRNTTLEGILPTEKPFIRGSDPNDNFTDVNINSSISVNDIFFPNTSGNGLDISTINTDNIKLFELGEFENETEEISGSISNISGGGDAFTFTPDSPLIPLTRYKFQVSQQLKLQNGLSFLPYEIIFTTGSGEEVPLPPDLAAVKFNKIENFSSDSSVFDSFTSLVIGPDRKLYASTAIGQIKRWNIQQDGSLTDVQVISPSLTSSRLESNGVAELRIIIGMVFDPLSTADSLILYISHSKLIDFTTPPAETDPPYDWDGKVTRLTGDNLENLQDILIRLPRSSKDHLTNSMAFSPSENRCLYISQGSNSGGGELDPIWKKRESLLSGAILKLDLNKLPTSLPLEVRTTNTLSVINNAPSQNYSMSDGTYNPYATNSPLTIYASGIRNAYDLLFHSNGELYVPTNGTAGGNNTPASSDYIGIRRINGEFYNHGQFPFVPKTVSNENQKDWLFRIEEGGYYGHPNPYRGEFVQNHGGITYTGITGQTGPYRDVKKYPPALGPDPNYRTPAYDFGPNKSPNGIIEYKSNAFGGALQGLMMVARFANGDDIVLMQAGGQQNDIVNAYVQVDGLLGLNDPLDLVEDPLTGNVYVSEFNRIGTGARLTLLRSDAPATPAPRLLKSKEEMIFSVTVDQASQVDEQVLLLSNAGTSPLTITNLAISGTFADHFVIQNLTDSLIQPGESQEFIIAFTPASVDSTLGHKEAFLIFQSNDLLNAVDSVVLSGLEIQNRQPEGEPWLQQIFHTVGYPVLTGWEGLLSNTNGQALGEEIISPLFVRSGNGPVTMKPLARFSDISQASFGWYNRKANDTLKYQVGILPSASIEMSQLLLTETDTLEDEFNPQGEVFGFYVTANSITYSEDAMNALASHKVRVYPAKDRQGSVISSTYLVVFETEGQEDFQDYVFLLKNVQPYQSNYQLAFDKPSLAFVVGGGKINPKPAELSASSVISGQAISLVPSAGWIILPSQVSLNTPLTFSVDTTQTGNGSATAYVVAHAFGFIPDTLKIELKAFSDIKWSYQINFQDGSVQSPIGFREDVGQSFGPKIQNGLELNYGWVLPGTNTPSSATITARNRNIPGVSVLDNTFNILNHINPTTYPPRNWTINLPNGEYYVNVSAGDPTSDKNRNHIVQANGVTVVSFDERTEPGHTKSDIEVINVTDGMLRLSPGTGSFTTCVNYVRITPTDSTLVETPDSLFVRFDKETLNFLVSGSTVSPKSMTLIPNAEVNPADITLLATAEWVLLPENISIGQPMTFKVDTTGLAFGNYSSKIIVSAPDFTPDTVDVTFYYPDKIDWAYQFNFQDGSVVSPQGFIDDIGEPYGEKSIDGLNLVYGWVLPNSFTPSSAALNARNRNIAGVNTLINTFTILNHTNPTAYPPRDWVVNLPAGLYYIEMSAGDPSAEANRKHVIKVQDDVLLSFDERQSPSTVRNFVETNVILIDNDTLRISPGIGGFNTSLNYIRLSPLDSGSIIRPDSLLLIFDQDQLELALTTETKPSLTATLSANSSVSGEALSLASSVPWITWTQQLALNTPMEFSIDTTAITPGVYDAEIVASANGFYSDTLHITVTYLGMANWTYKIDFKDPASPVPAGYIGDTGEPFGLKQIGAETLEFGWVIPQTLTPANSFSNTRNRNIAGVSALINTLNIINHPNATSNPARDWVMEVENGYYEVEVSVGDPYPDYNRNHVVDINGKNIVKLSGQEAQQLGINARKGFNIVKAADGKIRLTQGQNGYITCVSWIHVAPLRTRFIPPTVTAVFDGVKVDNRYLGSTTVTLEAIDQSGSGGILGLTYQLDDLAPIEYQGIPVPFNTPGMHTLVVKATDLFGNESEEQLSFEIKEISQASIALENTIKVPGSNRSFPSDTLFTFSRVKEPTNFEGITTKMHEKGNLLIRNTGTQPLIVNDIVISDVSQFSYQFVNQALSLPLQIPAGGSIELQINFIEVIGAKGIRKQTITFLSNADNGSLKAYLYGAYQVRTENFDEINSQQVLESFGYKTSMNGVIQPPSDYPTDESVANGDFGDMILSKTFVQADPTKPVQVIQAAAIHGTPQQIGLILLKKTSSDTVANFSFKHGQLHFQTLLPKIPASNTVPAGHSSPLIDEPFRIEVEGYRSSGGGFHGSNANTLLGIRTYLAIDGDGNVIPNEYFILQDNIGQGCDGGSSNCDWNDNIMYILNVRPEGIPTAALIDTLEVTLNEPFTYDISNYFTPGYPGNRLTYSAYLADYTTPLPDWTTIDSNSGILQGIPTGDTTSIEVGIEARDLNGLIVRSSFVLNVTSPLDRNSSDTARQVDLITGLEGEGAFNLDNLVIYPNPLEENILTLDFGDTIYESFFIFISNAQGAKVLEKNIDLRHEREFNLVLSDLPASLYNIKISDTHGHSIGRKLIVR